MRFYACLRRTDKQDMQPGSVSASVELAKDELTVSVSCFSRKVLDADRCLLRGRWAHAKVPISAHRIVLNKKTTGTQKCVPAASVNFQRVNTSSVKLV